jgi:hypothetical protein
MEVVVAPHMQHMSARSCWTDRHVRMQVNPRVQIRVGEATSLASPRCGPGVEQVLVLQQLQCRDLLNTALCCLAGDYQEQ